VNSKERDELKRLESHASKGPWTVESDHGDLHLRSGDCDSLMCDMQYYPWAPGEADFRFIAAARNAVLGLLAENQRMRELLAECAGCIGFMGKITLKREIESFLADHP
jgi:hypothetical protein